MRVGTGYDVHPLMPGDGLVLGGVKVPFHLSLSGHSDADVLLHAICDALLGAAALGDLGKYFPDTDTAYKGISSLKLLKTVGELVLKSGFVINNIDATLVAESPRLSGFIPEMIKNISHTLSLDPSRISVKATTTEGLGFAGRGEGIACHAVAALQESQT